MAPYGSYEELQIHESLGTDYGIRCCWGCSQIAIMAIHGGGIEPGTAEIAQAVAGDRHTFYAFCGLKHSGNAGLHISSRKFDEPLGVHIASQASVVITVHGCRDAKAVTYVGGRHHQLKARITAALTAAGFRALDAMRLPGINPKNICNAGRCGMGVQLEISQAMRRLLFHDILQRHRKPVAPCFVQYVRAIQDGIRQARC
jgi:phage replication-related protein YjqB (UPF0714/DUF867 family)